MIINTADLTRKFKMCKCVFLAAIIFYHHMPAAVRAARHNWATRLLTADCKETRKQAPVVVYRSKNMSTAGRNSNSKSIYRVINNRITFVKLKNAAQGEDRFLVGALVNLVCCPKKMW